MRIDMICDLPLSERPRERLEAHGVNSLSDAELLAILLGSGAPGKNAIYLARELLIGGMPALQQTTTAQLERVRGMGAAKAARISAAFEIGRRAASQAPQEKPLFETMSFGTGLVRRFQFPQEHLGVALLDAKHRVIREKSVYMGTINKAFVSTRDVIRHALDANAAAAVIYHNHPSGDPSPSREDWKYTRKVRRSLRLVDIELVDHIIIGAQGYCSLKERGWKMT